MAVLRSLSQVPAREGFGSSWPHRHATLGESCGGRREVRDGSVPVGWWHGDDKFLVRGIKKSALARYNVDQLELAKACLAGEQAGELPCMNHERFLEGMRKIEVLDDAVHLRYELDFQAIADALRVNLDTSRELLFNVRVFSQIGEEHAAGKLGFDLHGHKDARRRDGICQCADPAWRELVSVKGIGGPGKKFQLSSLIGGTGATAATRRHYSKAST